MHRNFRQKNKFFRDDIVIEVFLAVSGDSLYDRFKHTIEICNGINDVQLSRSIFSKRVDCVSFDIAAALRQDLEINISLAFSYMHQAVSVVFHICLFLFSWSSTIEMLRMDC
jgi:hypothetical protein